MIVATIILVLLALGCFVGMANSSYGGEGWGILGIFLLVVAFFTFLFSLNFKFGTENLTGYIYSSSDTAGYTKGHIRFSENAGTDEQPYFCAPSGSEAARKIKQYAGSGKKVAVTVQPYFYFSNNPFACGTDKVTVKPIN